MPTGLVRYHQSGHAHFITLSCHRKLPILGAPKTRDLLLRLLEDTRRRFHFRVYGYVVMNNHMHMLISEPEIGSIASVMQSLKQRFSYTRPEVYVWMERYHDFNVFTERKWTEKLRYMHRNPVKAGIVERPEDYSWSSFRFYAFHESTPVVLTDIHAWVAELAMLSRDRDLTRQATRPTFESSK